jgi:hypothetical protein
VLLGVCTIKFEAGSSIWLVLVFLLLNSIDRTKDTPNGE